MREDELKEMESLNEKSTVSKWWMPLAWAVNIVDQARQEQRVASDPSVQTLLNEISSIRKGLTGVQHYDTISVPLVYTQVSHHHFIEYIIMGNVRILGSDFSRVHLLWCCPHGVTMGSS